MKDFIIYIVVTAIFFLLVGLVIPDKKTSPYPDCEGLEVSYETDDVMVVDKVASEQRYRNCVRSIYGR